jgi:hypothetical protein
MQNPTAILIPAPVRSDDDPSERSRHNAPPSKKPLQLVLGSPLFDPIFKLRRLQNRLKAAMFTISMWGGWCQTANLQKSDFHNRRSASLHTSKGQIDGGRHTEWGRVCVMTDLLSLLY